MVPEPEQNRTVNPIQTWEDRLSPPITTGPPNVFHLPAALQHRIICMLYHLVTTRKKVRYEKFESKGCSNHLTKPLPGLVRHAMILTENSSNQLYAAGEELCKPQLKQLIYSLHQLSLTLKNSKKVANKNLNQLSLTVQTIEDSTKTANWWKSLERRRQTSV